MHIHIYIHIYIILDKLRFFFDISASKVVHRLTHRGIAEIWFLYQPAGALALHFSGPGARAEGVAGEKVLPWNATVGTVETHRN